jgi:hypothetical protein
VLSLHSWPAPVSRRCASSSSCAASKTTRNSSISASGSEPPPVLQITSKHALLVEQATRTRPGGSEARWVGRCALLPALLKISLYLGSTVVSVLSLALRCVSLLWCRSYHLPLSFISTGRPLGTCRLSTLKTPPLLTSSLRLYEPTFLLSARGCGNCQRPPGIPSSWIMIRHLDLDNNGICSSYLPRSGKDTHDTFNLWIFKFRSSELVQVHPF